MSELTEYAGAKAREVPDKVLDERKDEVLLFVCEKGVSFPTEMARHVDIDIVSLNRIVYNFKQKGFIDKLIPIKDAPQPQFKGRMAEFWGMGIFGFESFCRHSFWTLTHGGVDFIKAKYFGQGKTIQSGLAHYLEMEEEEKLKEEIHNGGQPTC